MVSSDEIRRRLEAKRRGETLHEEKKVEMHTFNCPECQTANLPKAKFCVGCGKPLPKEETPGVQPVQSSTKTQQASPSPVTESEEGADYKVCPSCNQKNKLNAKFCIICGHKFEENLAAENSQLKSVPEPGVKDETEVSPAHEVSEPASSVTEDFPEKSTEDVPDLVAGEPGTEEDIAEPSSSKSDETPAEQQKTPDVPEIKVPEHLKPSAESNLSESETDEIPQTGESPLKEPVQDVDPVEKIKKAKELMDIGAITQEEYDEIKNKYLKQI
ncbi:MAG: zinc ribbon domain-containing protein [Methanobacteriaceae archaeon]|nr:zinc ribbon domain-containing protein [Methanobacteriaceae archaeon]